MSGHTGHHLNILYLQCTSNQFGCDDGSCINLAVRCNDIKDCADYSDENNCKLFNIDSKYYRKEYPPMTSTKMPTEVKDCNNNKTSY